MEVTYNQEDYLEFINIYQHLLNLLLKSDLFIFTGKNPQETQTQNNLGRIALL